jgi:glycerate 2-kinase
MRKIREDAKVIIDESIKAVLPEAAVIKALQTKKLDGNIYLVAIGKAAWNMAKAATIALGSKVKKGVIVTKYDHSKGQIDNCEIIEAGHPLPDKNSILGAAKALELVGGLDSSDQVLFLISGGGSALFEKPLEGISLEDIMGITDQLLRIGADIVEINTIRKHLSAVKGGRFAQQCGKANIFAIVLSDVVGDKLDAIASGPAYPDSTSSQEALDIIDKYHISIEAHVANALRNETPKSIDNCETVVTGSVTVLCEAAARSAEKLGYTPLVLTSSLDGEVYTIGINFFFGW